MIWFSGICLLMQAQKVEREASELRGTMRKRMEFLDFD
jgi:U6 snRNA-associated Sm-like protein LSm1